MSTDEIVDYFVQYGRESTRKRPTAEVAERLGKLESISREDGLEPKHILLLIDVAGSGKLAAATSSRIIRNLIPAQTVPERAVLKAISWICTNKPSSTIQTLLVRWIIMIYDFMDGHNQLHALYGIIFFFLENEQMCPYVCHLLHLMTRREDVLLFRLRALINLQQRMGRQTYIIGLLSIYKLYCPQLVTMTLPRVPKSFFKQTDRAWGAIIRKVQEKNTHEESNRSASVLHHSSLSPAQRSNPSYLEPLSKRRKLEVVPSNDLCTVRTDKPTGFRPCTSKTKDRMPTSLLTSFDIVLKNLGNIQMPSRLASVLQHQELQHAMTLETDHVTAYRLSYWVHHALSQEFSCEATGAAYVRQGKLLRLLIQFSDFLQESMPVWENFLTKYLHTWNGNDHRDTILALITRIRLTEPAALNELVLEPLRKLFFASKMLFKCQIICCLRQLLVNYVAVETPRHDDSMKSQLTQKIGNEESDTAFNCMFSEEVHDFSSVQTLRTLLDFVDSICVVAVAADTEHALLLHCLAEFYGVVVRLFHTWKVPLVWLPHRALFYRLLFSNNIVAVSSAAGLMISYRKTFEVLRVQAKTYKEGDSRHACAIQSLQQVTLFNHLLLDMCNTIWRDKAFLPGQNGSVFELMARPDVKRLSLTTEPDAFSLRRHPALIGYSIGFLRETQPPGKHCHVADLRKRPDELLQYLTIKDVKTIPEFINKSIRRTKSTSKATPSTAT